MDIRLLVPRRLMPRRRRSRLLLGGVLLLLLAATGLWLARMPIARHFISGELARRHVPARYAITDLGLGRQRLTDVVVGDPARPDLVADWIEAQTGVGLSGPTLVGVRAGHVRVRGRLVGGRVSLGAIDRLLPAPSGKPFALPALALDVADARLRLTTPHGVVGIALSGSGRLDDGFAGRAAVRATTLAIGNCRVGELRATTAIHVRRRAPSLTGVAGAAPIACGTRGAVLSHRPRTRFDVTLTPALDGWRGRLSDAGIAVVTLASGQRGDKIHADIRFAGDANRTAGRFTGASDALHWRWSSGAITARRTAYRGTFAVGSAGNAVSMTATAEHASLDPAFQRAILARGRVGAGTPVAPLVNAAALAASRAVRDFRLTATVDARVANGRAAVRLSSATGVSASGATIVVRGREGIVVDGGVHGSTAVLLRGGGLPTGTINLARRTAQGPLTGTASVAPYAAGAARLAVTDAAFAATPHGNTRLRARVDLSGPFGDGRIEGLTFPIEALWDGRGRLAINTDCTLVAVRRLAVAGLSLDPARLRLCPAGAALVTVASGRLGGGARLAATRLQGRMGGAPLTLAASGAEVALGSGGFIVRGVATRLGAPDRATRLDFASVVGRIDRGALAGRFDGGAGQLPNVPLLLTAAVGNWASQAGTLTLTGALSVSDAQAASPRFKPMRAQDVALRLARGQVTATGTLDEPTTGTIVGSVRIEHLLASGIGHANLAVPGLAFAKGFQPDLLTPVTFGVIADVKGKVSGEGRIDWSPRGVTSNGVFRTPGVDLAAAFGPVTGITGEIRFTDLLALESAPNQVATVKSINPGIVVEDGRITYQTLAGTRVRVEQGRWPFAGGTLTLAPTLLDFANSGERRMTFRVDGAAADRFLQQFDFKNLNATGIFDGELPMVFDASGGRLENGHLVMRVGGGSLAYVGDLSQKDLGFWGNFAFGALKSLRYRSLSVVMNGPLAGEMVTEVKFAGVSQGEGAKSNFLIRRLQKLPIVFNIRIKAPFRGLLDSAQSFYDPSRLIQRNLPTLLQQQRAAPTPVQPPASGTVP